MLLLDTNVVSEPVQTRPNADVVAWIAAQDPHQLHLSVVTLGEIEDGIWRMAASSRRSRLETWRDTLVASAGPRLLPVDLEVARAWGMLRARLATDGVPIAPIDGLIAATAEVFGLTVITRNVKRFEAWGGPIINPWPT